MPTQSLWLIWKGSRKAKMGAKMSEAHKSIVKALVKPGDEILLSLTSLQTHLLHMAVGIAGEAGELLDAIKKHAVYQKPLDIENVIEELGDLEFYMEGLRESLLITRDATLSHNVEKLQRRYSTGTYSNEQAQQRADKEGQ
jgi:NTP pyrophosphatase (non-canonical NTP hydrolase)